MSHKVFEILRDARLELKDLGIESFALDAEVLLRNVLDISRAEILTSPELLVSDESFTKFQEMLSMRKKFKPIQYILHTVEFMSLDFYVNENVLIPRGDTEILVEYGISEINKNGYKNILELGTGSGCISVSVAANCQDVNVVAVDISQEALEVARKNAAEHLVGDRIEFLHGDLFEPLGNVEHKFDLILSNPPYIRQLDIETLGENVKLYEPRLALDGGLDGLFFYKKISESAKKYLRETGGMIIFEVGHDQADEVSEILRNLGYQTEVVRDLASIERVVVARI